MTLPPQRFFLIPRKYKYLRVKREIAVFPRRTRSISEVTEVSYVIEYMRVTLRALRTTPCPPWNGTPYFLKTSAKATNPGYGAKSCGCPDKIVKIAALRTSNALCNASALCVLCATRTPHFPKDRRRGFSYVNFQQEKNGVCRI